MADVPAWASVVDFLSLLNEECRSELLEGSRRERLPASTITVYAPGNQAVDLIEHGVIRAFQTAPDGRQASVAYLHSTELVGSPILLGVRHSYNAQLVTETTLLRLDGRKLLTLFETELNVSGALAVYLAHRVFRAHALLAVRSLGSMRERLCYDLLERACQAQLRSGHLSTEATHEDLANSIGSSREVVTRILGDLRRSGIVATTPGRVTVLDVERLSGIVHGLVT